MTSPPCNASSTYGDMTRGFTCMTYALARGHLAGLDVAGVDMVAPAGLAWHIVMGADPMPAACKVRASAE